MSERRRTRSRAAVALLCFGAVVLAGCTGVPSHSQPQVVKTVPIGEVDNQPPPTPTPNIAPRNLVGEFLQANAADASEHASARAFLAPATRNRWSDTTATIVDSTNVTYRAGRSSVIVRGRVLGTVGADGIYTPLLAASNAQKTPFVYGISKVHGQYRIDNLRPGLLLTETDFLHAYSQYSAYFFDLSDRYLVPDPRWTSLTDPTQLFDWLMTQLAGEPSDVLQNAVSTDSLPTQASSRRISVSVGRVTKIEIPGASQLNAASRDHLAAQVAVTLNDADRDRTTERTFEITDNSKPVTIPQVGSAKFTAAPFGATAGPAPLAPSVYFLRDGRLVGEDGKQLNGRVNNGEYYLQSVAVSQEPGVASLSVAGVATSGSGQRLLLGTESGGLRATSVTGVLSRPAFAPGRDEAWVGDGKKVFLVTPEGKTDRVTPVGLPSTAAGDEIVALRLSPEGSRIAMILKSADGEQQLYVGAVVREAGQVRIGPLQQVSPEGVVVTDVAWAESLKLYAIGYNSASREPQIYHVGSDGSALNIQGIGNLPQAPTSLTVAINQPAWVTSRTSSSSSVWVQSVPSIWVSPTSGTGDETEGYDPIYLE